MSSKEAIEAVDKLLKLQKELEIAQGQLANLSEVVSSIRSQIDQEKCYLIGHTAETKQPVCVLRGSSVFTFPVPPSGYRLESLVNMLDLKETVITG